MNQSNCAVNMVPINRLDYVDVNEFSYPINVFNTNDMDNSDRNAPIDPKDDNSSHEKNEEDLMPFDLDVPGAELDDKDEEIGEEDEENNYYSIGGDNHNDLEESE